MSEPPPFPEDFIVGAWLAEVGLSCPACGWEHAVDPFDPKAGTLGALLAEAVQHVGESHPPVRDDEEAMRP